MVAVNKSEEGTRYYDYTAYTECKSCPEAPLYNGGILSENGGESEVTYYKSETGAYSPAFVLYNLTESTRYTFSWTTLARSRCWSFLKGGFVLDSSSDFSVLYFQSADINTTVISIKSASLQPFSVDQWNQQQQDSIQQNRKRNAIVHVSDTEGNRISGATVSIQQLAKDFPFGSAIAKTILGNKPYQEWFVKRFNAAVFENELKWYATEPEPGQLNYTTPDEMLEFIRANQITVRGHNIFWEDPLYTPSWVRNLTGDALRAAVDARITSLLSRYKGDFVHWDVSNELLHFDFYEQRLGPNASLGFFDTVRKIDPLATLFMNDFNVIETCNDDKSTVDNYIVRLKELNEGGGILEGIGLEGHFVRKGCYQMCLTDGDFNNLPAGNVVDKLLQEWETKETQGTTNDHGSYTFDGFLGEYMVSVSVENRSTEVTFSLGRSDETEHLNIQL
ncbi:putative endo-1,4-beta-xylanase C [Ananas comosus]|uniref:Putative endo-1,4-beta-xylanase C n=1 Tax=Ananas comosus TaxID=4615 RepID=A0A199UMG5_ANACO|nr:putative endo-1,4-beta-xylanase C [Ananas comosus]